MDFLMFSEVGSGNSYLKRVSNKKVTYISFLFDMLVKLCLSFTYIYIYL